MMRREGSTWASSRVFDICAEEENGLDCTNILQLLRERNARCQKACIVAGDVGSRYRSGFFPPSLFNLNYVLQRKETAKRVIIFHQML